MKSASGVHDRRGTYFAFQGLLMAVLILLFVYQRQNPDGWTGRFFLLSLFTGASLLFLHVASLKTLSNWWVQVGFFLTDVAVSSLALQWTHSQWDLYLLYVFIIFGTALSGRAAQSFLVALVTTALYLAASWSPVHGLPHDPVLWLRVLFFWIMTLLLAVLSRDSKRTQQEQERRYQERLIQLERLAALGQVAGEVAHRIKGPLTTILVNAEVLAQKNSGAKEMLLELDQIREEVAHCKEILKTLLDLGRIEEVDPARIDLRKPIRSAVKSLETQLHSRGIRLEISGLEKPLPMLGDASLLHEAVAAVLQNAYEAARRGGRIRLRVQRERRGIAWLSSRNARGGYRVLVEDDGRGIHPRDLERVFQPFFTTKGDGHGLGLSAALRILQKHSGSIEADSDGPGKGACFVLTLPRAG